MIILDDFENGESTVLMSDAERAEVERLERELGAAVAAMRQGVAPARA
jgi:hypothetical protein